MTIEQMIEFITIDTEAKRIANKQCRALGEYIHKGGSETV